MADEVLEIRCGEFNVDVYPRRFSPSFSAMVRLTLGKGPRQAYVDFMADTPYELDRLAELIVVGYLQAGRPLTLEQALALPVLERWDRDGGTVNLVQLEAPDLIEAVGAAAEDVPDPER